MTLFISLSDIESAIQVTTVVAASTSRITTQVMRARKLRGSSRKEAMA
jgi:hypothetical protein